MKQILFVLMLCLGTALAQGTIQPTMSQVTTAALIGKWQTSVPIGDGMPPAEGTLTINPDGSYREEMLFQGQLAGFWEGSYSLTPDGIFSQTELSKSPQICVQGQCFSNDGPNMTVSTIVKLDANHFTVRIQDPESGEVFTLEWQRVLGAAIVNPQPGPQLPLPACKPGMTPAPQGNCVAAAPVTPENNGFTWAGNYSDGAITLQLGGLEGDYLEREGVRYPLSLQANNAMLEGTFSSGNDSFPLSLERLDNIIVLRTGNARYELTSTQANNPFDPPVNPLDTPTNPLGN